MHPEYRLVLDENISPRIAPDLWAQNIDALPLRDRGMLGATDRAVWRFANADRRTVVSINERDFRKLAANDRSHCGFICLPPGGIPQEQFAYIMAILERAGTSASAMANRFFGFDVRGEIKVDYVFDQRNSEIELFPDVKTVGAA